MNLIYIHGASATGDSFNYIRSHITGHSETLIEYDSSNGFTQNLVAMKQQLNNTKDMVFVCHSLGGIYAVYLAQHFGNRVRGAVTLSTPYGGAESAEYAKYFWPFNRLLRDIGPGSAPIKDSNAILIQHPWLNVVTTRGDSPWIMQPNDGVATVSSMQRRTDMQFRELYINHYEVVMSPDTVAIIDQFVKSVD
jgi:pimeloyl-ACP methyl ester carboxylesterase